MLPAGLQQLVGIEAHHETSDIQKEVVGSGDANGETHVFNNDGAVFDQEYAFQERRPRKLYHLTGRQIRYGPRFLNMGVDSYEAAVIGEEARDEYLTREFPRQGVAASLTLIGHGARESLSHMCWRISCGRQRADQYESGCGSGTE